MMENYQFENLAEENQALMRLIFANKKPQFFLACLKLKFINVHLKTIFAKIANDPDSSYSLGYRRHSIELRMSYMAMMQTIEFVEDPYMAMILPALKALYEKYTSVYLSTFGESFTPAE